MGELRNAEPLEVASLGLRLRQTAAAVADVRPARGPASWRGRAADAFGLRLAGVARVLPRIEEAYDDAGQALLAYARALEDAQVLCRRAAALRHEADRLSALSTMPGPDPGDALRMDADRWAAQASELHDAAARRATAELLAIAASAPRARRGAGQDRFWSDSRTSVWSQLAGAAGLVVTAGEALGGNRAARDELVSVAKQSWRVWEPFVELYQQLDDDRGGLAVGGAVALVGGRGLGGKVPGAGPPKPDGFLKGIRTGELTVDDISRAWDEAHAEVALRERILSLRGVPLPSVEQLVSGKVDLAHHEAYPGSHTIQKHVGKSVAFLRARLRLEGVTEGGRSTFTDLARAEAAVADALARSADAVRAFAASDVPKLNVVVRNRMSGGGTVLRADGSWGAPVYVHVVLRKLSDGSVLIETAMLRETWTRALTGR
jgi:uncharacterized protein YukE